MSINKTLLSATLATAAAVCFAVAPVASVAASSHKVPCYGVNGCKGQSQCKTAKSTCKGQNQCKGQGVMMKTEKQCKKLKGSTEEPKS